MKHKNPPVFRWIILVRDWNGKFYPHTDVHGNATAYATRKSAGSDLFRLKELNGKRNAYLQRYVPGC
jgi:hypothetical protein